MKKPYSHTETTPYQRCGGCAKPLKRNLLAKNPDAKLCYSCYKKGLEIMKARKRAGFAN